MLAAVRQSLKNVIPEATRYRLRRIEQLAKLPLYLGSGAYCACCQRSFRKFLYFYGRDNVRCPYCNSLPRQRYQAHLLSKAPFFPVTDRSVLHIAPEFSLTLVIDRMKPRSYVKADSMVTFIPGVCVRPDVIMDLRRLDLPPDSIDLVICNHVLEHIEEDRKAVAEIYRVLRPRGIALITVPVSTQLNETLEDSSIVTPERRQEKYGSPDHVRLYGIDIVDRFRTADFLVRISRPQDEVASRQIELWVLAKNEPHFILTKKGTHLAGTSKKVEANVP